MSRDVGLYLADIELACRKIIRYTSGCSFKEFTRDDEKYDAVLRNLEIIGEAVKHIPEDVREQYPKIKWRKIAGLRDIVAHEYFGISDELIWDIVQNEISPLLKSIKALVKIL
jgi:uncharacterized protein with HEPN domain